MTPENTLNPQVVRAIQINRGAAKESNEKNSSFMIHLATITMVAEDKKTTTKEPQTFIDA